MSSIDDVAPRVYILHENPDWIPPLAAALEAEGVAFSELHLTGGSIDLTAAPADGVYWSRFSASSHTRGHAGAKDFARSTLRWLEAHGRRVVNGSRVVDLEVSKVSQYLALAAAGFDVPRTIAVFGRDDLSRRARELPTPFITKHNQGGKGLGVRRFDSYDEFDAYVSGPDFEEPIDGITLLQEYLLAREPFITRAEFVGGRFVYAVRVDTSAGSFELCPAEACAVPEQGFAPAVCEVPGAVDAGLVIDPPTPAPLFTRREDITAETPLIARLEAFLRDNGIEVAGIEFIETADGRVVPYDVNTNTNYNPDVEHDGGPSGAAAVARFLADELSRTAAVRA
ncbi:RimK family alpha-L-glutamate ligase [Herbiconiux sp. L3-i23]|uniref:ATP-grasp domain-containing protein n=1 Tax=Herbiconiux sp. L3-i23 TaxID=2905871 RepID=UPI00205ED7D4|nr:alpha-L-glutamate ligase [Herbiconiux sp. L3-i23]BDI23131.1 glutathione synthase [Herbiconiux sp. L3-i23]